MLEWPAVDFDGELLDPHLWKVSEYIHVDVKVHSAKELAWYGSIPMFLPL